MVNNNAQVARKHGLSQDTIQYWCKNEDNISKYFFQIKYLSTTLFSCILYAFHQLLLHRYYSQEITAL